MNASGIGLWGRPSTSAGHPEQGVIARSEATKQSEYGLKEKIA